LAVIRGALRISVFARHKILFDKARHWFRQVTDAGKIEHVCNALGPRPQAWMIIPRGTAMFQADICNDAAKIKP
jgi:hypothetical protein